MKARARYTPRLKSWAFWIPPDGWSIRRVGFGFTLDEAVEDWKAIPRKPCTPGKHCERYAQGLGGCVAGYCNPPAPAQ